MVTTEQVVLTALGEHRLDLSNSSIGLHLSIKTKDMREEEARESVCV